MEEENDVSTDTLDRDEMMESEFFDNRHAFLSLCQGNQYQYDTLRRAKHSSMMVLYHLHNPNAPAFITSCIICHTELETGQGWKCKICSDFDVCNSCISSQEVQKHPHKFVARPAPADQSAANKEARQQRMLQLRAMLELLVHASQCREASCQYGKCRNMKDLFRHGYSCTKRATGGCSLCKRVWFLLTSHAKSCKETKCTVPRCMDLREHARRLQLQQESRRRAAVNEMIRQRAAEAAGGNQWKLHAALQCHKMMPCNVTVKESPWFILGHRRKCTYHTEELAVHEDGLHSVKASIALMVLSSGAGFLYLIYSQTGTRCCTLNRTVKQILYMYECIWHVVGKTTGGRFQLFLSGVFFCMHARHGYWILALDKMAGSAPVSQLL